MVKYLELKTDDKILKMMSSVYFIRKSMIFQYGIIYVFKNLLVIANTMRVFHIWQNNHF